jgi:hypothetical protein
MQQCRRHDPREALGQQEARREHQQRGQDAGDDCGPASRLWVLAGEHDHGGDGAGPGDERCGELNR